MPRIEDPPWKRKTRPCPFFSKGSCFFAEQCNFIHTIKSPVTPEIRVTAAQDVRKSSSIYWRNTYQQTVTATMTPPEGASPSSAGGSDGYPLGQEVPSLPMVLGAVVWGSRRRPSWASVHSEGSELSYPTDRSPTESRSSSQDIMEPGEDRPLDNSGDGDDEAQVLNRRSSYSLVAPVELSPPRTRKERRAMTDAPDDEFAQFEAPTYDPVVPLELDQTDSEPCDSCDPDEDDLVIQPTPSSSSTFMGKHILPQGHSEMSLNRVPDPLYKKLDVSRSPPVVVVEREPDTGTSMSDFPPFSPNSFKGTDAESPLSPGPAASFQETADEDMLSQDEMSEDDLQSDPLTDVEEVAVILPARQVPLEDVLARFQSLGLPARILPSQAQVKSASDPVQVSPPRPHVFQGADRNSYAFREHLAGLISKRSDVIHGKKPQAMTPVRELVEEIAQPTIQISSPLSTPGRLVVPLTLANLTRHTESTFSPLASPMSAFKRPVRPGRRKSITKRPAQAAGPSQARQPPPEDQPNSPSTPDPDTPMITNSPLTDSPEDFRAEKRRRISSAQFTKPVTRLPIEPRSPEDVPKEREVELGDVLEGYMNPSPPQPAGSGSRSSTNEATDQLLVQQPIPSSVHPETLVETPPNRPPSPPSVPQAETPPEPIDIVSPPSSNTSSSIKLRPLRLSKLLIGGALGNIPNIYTPPPRAEEQKRHTLGRPLSILITEENEESSTPVANSFPHSAPLPLSLSTTSDPSKRSSIQSLTHSRITYTRSNDQMTTLTDRRISRPVTSHATFSFPSVHPSSSSRQSLHRPLLHNQISTSNQLQLEKSVQPDLPSSSKRSSIVVLRNPRDSIRSVLSIPHNPSILPPSPLLPSPIIDSPPSASSSERPNPHLVPASRASKSPASSHSPSPSVVNPPHLFFAIAADNPDEVRRLLATKQADANDEAGPEEQSALAFAMSNGHLKNKLDIIKVLMEYGADPSVLKTSAELPGRSDSQEGEGIDDGRRDSIMTIKGPPRPSGTVDSTISWQNAEISNPAIDYYLTRVTEIPPRQLEMLRTAGFDPLTRMPFHMIGQDMVLTELLRVLASHASRAQASPISVIFAGPSGHGKSMLSRNIGNLLQLPAHTVNMTNLRSQDELLDARSLTSTSGNLTLAGFLSLHEGRRCVVILEEIEKAADKCATNTLLMPWEIGKLNTPARLFDTSNVIWISTSNAGENDVFDFNQRVGEDPCTRRDYLDLSTKIRRSLIDNLGASLVSRITTVLPFLAFTATEKRAIAYQHLTSLKSSNLLSKAETDTLLENVLLDYIPSEGVRSVHRAVQMRLEEDLW